MRLYVGVLRAKEFLGAVARQVLHHVGKFAPTVITLTGIAFRVLVGENRAGSFEHRFTHEVLRGDQFEAFVLTAFFVFNRLSNCGIRFRQGEFHRIGRHDGVLCTSDIAIVTRARLTIRQCALA